MTTIYTGYVDTTVLSNHRSPKGAAAALIDEMQARLSRNGSTPISDGERTILIDLILDTSVIALDQGAGTSRCAVPVERMTQMAFVLNRTFSVKATTLLD